MATQITLHNPKTGLSATAYKGFSWTTFFWGPIVSLFRGDFITFLIIAAIDIILSMATFIIGAIIFNIAWAFFYNSYQMRSLIAKGYMTEQAIAQKQASQTEAVSKGQTELADAIARGVAQALTAQKS